METDHHGKWVVSTSLKPIILGKGRFLLLRNRPFPKVSVFCHTEITHLP